jgi:hypothetical protein
MQGISVVCFAGINVASSLIRWVVFHLPAYRKIKLPERIFTMSKNYYIIGTKYGGHKDVYPDMVARGAVSIGYSREIDLSNWYGASEKAIVEYLRSLDQPKVSCHNLKRFLNIRPGDLIAVKRSGSPLGEMARLVIAGYAVAQEKDEKLYHHDPNGLGHLISVRFLETESDKEFNLGYGQTVHRPTIQPHIQQIFSDYYGG